MVCHAGVLVCSGLGIRHHLSHASAFQVPMASQQNLSRRPSSAGSCSCNSSFNRDPGSRCPRLVSAAQCCYDAFWGSAPLPRFEESSPGAAPSAPLTDSSPGLQCLPTGRPLWPCSRCLDGRVPAPDSIADAKLFFTSPACSCRLHLAAERYLAACLARGGRSLYVQHCALPSPKCQKKSPKARRKAKCSRRWTTLLSSNSSDTPSDLASSNEVADTTATALASSSGSSSRSEGYIWCGGSQTSAGVNAPIRAALATSLGPSLTTAASGPPVPSPAPAAVNHPAGVTTTSPSTSLGVYSAESLPRRVDGTAAGASGRDALRISYSSSSSPLSETVYLLRTLLSVPTSCLS